MKLLDYWIPKIQDVIEFKEIAKTEQPEIDLLKEAIEQFPKEVIVSDASVVGLSRWENVLDIIKDKDIDVRRFNILMKLNNKVNLTYRWLENKMKLAVGEKCYQIDLDHDKYQLRVSVTSDKEYVLISLQKELRKLIPANLGLATSSLEHEECGIYTGVIIRTFDHYTIGG